MQLINKQNDVAFALFDFVQNRLQTFLKFAAVLCTGDQRAHIQRENSLVFQRTRHITAHNTLCQTFCDGGLADARFADQNRIVLGFTRQNPDDVTNLIISADDRIHLFLASLLDQIRAVFLQRIIGILRRIRRHALVAAHRGQRLQEIVFLDAECAEQITDRACGCVNQRKEQMLNRNKVVLHLLCGMFRLIQGLLQIRSHIHAAGIASAGYPRQLFHCLTRLSFEIIRVNAHFCHKLGNQSAVLMQQGEQQMLLSHFCIAVLIVQRVCILDCFQRFLRKFLCIHGVTSLGWTVYHM